MLTIEPIAIKAKKRLKTSVWAFNAANLEPGESAAITGVYAADADNPLYQVTKANGDTFAVYRRQLVECGALDLDAREINL